jgi:hypothetical protein
MSRYATLITQEGANDDLVKELGDAVSVLPYAKHVWAAIKWFRTKRVTQFLRGLGRATEAMSDDEKRRFQQVIDSDAGGALLSQYMDGVLKSSSRAAIAAYALLYADAYDMRYPRAFKATAGIALDGIPDWLIEIYLEILENLPAATGDLFRVVGIGTDLERWPKVRELCPTPAARASAINELIRRGLLIPSDWSGVRHGPQVVSFGYPDTSRLFLELLSQAHALALTLAE